MTIPFYDNFLGGRIIRIRLSVSSSFHLYSHRGQ